MTLDGRKIGVATALAAAAISTGVMYYQAGEGPTPASPASVQNLADRPTSTEEEPEVTRGDGGVTVPEVTRGEGGSGSTSTPTPTPTPTDAPRLGKAAVSERPTSDPTAPSPSRGDGGVKSPEVTRGQGGTGTPGS